MRWVSFCALVLLFASAGDVRAQERRDSTRGAAATSATSVEELHRIRRMWLEQRRQGQLNDAPPAFGSAIVGAPGTGRATGVVVPGAAGGFGAYDGGYGAFGYAGGGRGIPFVPPFAFGHDGREGLPYPAYPPVGRFYGRFHEDALRDRRWSDPLLFGVREYEPSWWGWWPSYPGVFGWADGAYGWYSAPPWSRSPADCVDVTLELGNGRAHRLQLGLQSLGLADARDLDLAIDARLSEGRPVMLQGLDGRLLRIDPGTQIDDILVRPCGQ